MPTFSGFPAACFLGTVTRSMPDPRRSPRIPVWLAALAVAAFVLPAPARAELPFRRPHMHRPAHGCQISVGPVVVDRGTELTECTYFKLPSKRDMSVNRVRIKV